MKKLSLAFLIPSLIFILNSCSNHEEPMRVPEDIMGVWQMSSDSYLEFADNNEVHKLVIRTQDDETIGQWWKDVYFYEPGYNLVIYLNAENEAKVYQIVSFSEKSFTWCWVDDIHQETVDKEGIGNVIGQIINKAQDGYKLNPELYETLQKIPFDQFLNLLESLDIMYPWAEL